MEMKMKQNKDPVVENNDIYVLVECMPKINQTRKRQNSIMQI